MMTGKRCAFNGMRISQPKNPCKDGSITGGEPIRRDDLMESNTSDVVTPGEKNGLGGKIRQLRLQRKISMQKLATMSDLTPSTISQLERNLTNPSIPALRRIAAALNVPVFFFFMDEQTDESELIVRSDKRRSIFNPSRNVSFELSFPKFE